MTAGKLSIFIPHASDFLTNHQPHGDGLAAYGFVSRLAERGHTVHVAAPEIALRGAQSRNLRLHPIKTVFKSTIPHRLEYMLRSRLLLNRLRRTEQIDVIHQLNPVNKGMSLAMIGSGLPVVLGVIVPSWPDDAEAVRLSWWQCSRDAIKRWIKNRLLTMQQWQASALLLATPAARSNLHRAELVNHKIVHLPLGVDAERFAPAEAEPEELNILFLANLWRRKGIFTLLEAFAQVAKQFPNCRLMIAGDGGERAEVERLVRAAPHRAQITMLGGVTRAEVPDLLRRAAIYCLPSYGEPFANSVLEAMACGKPIVLTAAGGIQEMMPDNGGRKVPPRDAQALAAALIELLGSAELRAEMGRNNRLTVETVYSWERVIDRLEQVYDSLTARELLQTMRSVQLS